MSDKLHPHIVMRAVSDLIPYARNARTHDETQITEIAASIREFWFTNPILTDGENGVIAGHGRLAAATKLKMIEVPVIELAHLTPQQRKAYILADNRLAEKAGWNMELVALELEELNAAGFDLNLTGFGDFDLKRTGLTDPDDTPELDTKNIISKLWDVWILGKHRIVCGDSTRPETVALALGETSVKKCHLMVTDPPYGVSYDASWRKGIHGKEKSNIAVGKVLNDDRADWREVWAIAPATVAYVWHSGNFAHIVHDSLIASGFQIRSQIVWAKGRHVISRGHYHPRHEPCLYGVKWDDDHWSEDTGERFESDHELAVYSVKKGATGKWRGSRKESTLWEISHLKNDTGHSTQKPVECMARPIRNNSAPWDGVYEPFSGSGTTLIACEVLNRHCHAIELSPEYVDMAVRRWCQFTGSQARRESDLFIFPV